MFFIKITKNGLEYVATPMGLPGVTVKAVGKTEAEAIGNLVLAVEKGMWFRFGGPSIRIERDYNG